MTRDEALAKLAGNTLGSLEEWGILLDVLPGLDVPTREEFVGWVVDHGLTPGLAVEALKLAITYEETGKVKNLQVAGA